MTGLIVGASFTGTTVDGAFVLCLTLMFLDKVTNDLNVLTTVILKRLLGMVSTKPLATCSRFVHVSCGNESIKNVPSSVVRTNTGVSLHGGIVLFFAGLRVGEFDSDVLSTRMLVSISSSASASSSKLSMIATARPLLRATCRFSSRFVQLSC